MANVDGEVRVLAALDALEEVVVLTFRIRVEVKLIGADHGVQNPFRTRLDFTPPTFVADPAVRTNELDARVTRFAGHDHSVGVAVSDVIILDRVEQSALPMRTFALHLNRAG